jgi:mRNA interferase RelE/StbE
MEVIITKTFTKQYLRCPGNVQASVRDLITSLENAKSLNEIKDLKKLSGFKNYFRIRIGQYRVGVKEEKPKVYLFCILERSQIYKVFPPNN